MRTDRRLILIVTAALLTVAVGCNAPASAPAPEAEGPPVPDAFLQHDLSGTLDKGTEVGADGSTSFDNGGFLNGATVP